MSYIVTANRVKKKMWHFFLGSHIKYLSIFILHLDFSFSFSWTSSKVAFWLIYSMQVYYGWMVCRHSTKKLILSHFCSYSVGLVGPICSPEHSCHCICCLGDPYLGIIMSLSIVLLTTFRFESKTSLNCLWWTFWTLIKTRWRSFGLGSQMCSVVLLTLLVFQLHAVAQLSEICMWFFGRSFKLDKEVSGKIGLLQRWSRVSL